jgi:hypothetical protein
MDSQGIVYRRVLDHAPLLAAIGAHVERTTVRNSRRFADPQA